MTAKGVSNETFVFDNVALSFEGDDIAFMRFRGIVDAPAVIKMLDVHAKWAGTKSHIFILADLHNLDRFTMEARREFQTGRSKALAMTAIAFGTRFHVRVMIEMILRAARMLGRLPADIDLHFVNSEAEARDIVAQRRASRR